MKKNVDALKTLYVALGGDADDVADITKIPDMIEEIATVAGAVAGAVLPEVDTDDNGKIMKVVEGEWALANDATAQG